MFKNAKNCIFRTRLRPHRVWIVLELSVEHSASTVFAYNSLTYSRPSIVLSFHKSDKLQLSLLDPSDALPRAHRAVHRGGLSM